jgi:hypothetical protein
LSLSGLFLTSDHSDHAHAETLHPFPPSSHLRTLFLMDGGYLVRGAAADWDVEEAVVRLLQNATDQVGRAYRHRNWRGLRLEDLRNASDYERLTRKDRLRKEYPILPLCQSFLYSDPSEWRPILVLSGSVPMDEFHDDYLATAPQKDLRILVVLWRHMESRLISISLYNNHLDSSVTSRHLALRGVTVNTDEKWTNGSKGQSFMNATHTLQLALAKDRAGNTTGKINVQLGESLYRCRWLSIDGKVVREDGKEGSPTDCLVILKSGASCWHFRGFPCSFFCVKQI